MTFHKHLQTLDKRGQKSWHAIRNAFVDLVLSKRYDEIKVNEIITKSGVARSTFYEHFKNKDSILAQSLYLPLSRLANAIHDNTPLTQIEDILQHFWENRSFCRIILNGPPRRSVIMALTELLETQIKIKQQETMAELIISARHAATQIAESQVALMNIWLLGEAKSSVENLALALKKTTNNLFDALKKTNHQ